MIDDQFGHWLAGFIDGEGCFTISRSGHGSYQPRFGVVLRADDRPILEDIRQRTGLGVIQERTLYPGRNPQVEWVVTAKRECATLAALLTTYPLRAKKARDFEVWASAVAHYVGRNWRRGGGRWRANDWSAMGQFKAALEAVRTFESTGLIDPAPESYQQLEMWGKAAIPVGYGQ